jgi:hypothetical protein
LIAGSFSIWGDWSAHFTFINAIRERGIAWIAGDNPLFPGAPFQYPFLSHLLTAIFGACLRIDTPAAVYASSLILMASLPTVLFRLFKSFGLASWPALSSVVIFLCIGGFQWLSGGLNPNEPLTNQFNEGSVFTQFVLFELFPQRAFLFGLTAFSLLFTWAFQTKTQKTKNWILLGIAFSMLSLIHVHTWIAMGTLIMAVFIFPPVVSKFRVDRKSVFYFGLAVIALSSLSL